MGFLLSLGAVLYCLPMLIAYGRGHTGANSIALVNVLLGWTLAGWLVVLFQATAELSYPDAEPRRRPGISRRTRSNPAIRGGLVAPGRRLLRRRPHAAVV